MQQILQPGVQSRERVPDALESVAPKQKANAAGMKVTIFCGDLEGILLVDQLKVLYKGDSPTLSGFVWL